MSHTNEGAATYGNRIGTVERIHIVPETSGDPEPLTSVEAVADRGIEEDRYYEGKGGLQRTGKSRTK